MVARRRIQKWLAEQAAEPQVPPSCPPSTPSESCALPYLHPTDDSSSSCSTCSRTERQLDQERTYLPTPLAIHRPRPSHVQAISPTQIRVGPNAFYTGTHVPVLRRMRSYSMDDLTSTNFIRRPNYSGQYQHLSIQQGSYPTSVASNIAMPLQHNASYPVTIPQPQVPWKSTTASSIPFEMSHMYQPQYRNLQNYQRVNPQGITHQYPSVPMQQSSVQLPSSSMAASNPNVFTQMVFPISVSPPKSRSRSHSRSYPPSTTEGIKKLRRDDSRRSVPTPEQTKQPFFKRVIKSIIIKTSKPVAPPPKQPKSILKKMKPAVHNPPVEERTHRARPSHDRTRTSNKRIHARSQSAHR